MCIHRNTPNPDNGVRLPGACTAMEFVCVYVCACTRVCVCVVAMSGVRSRVAERRAVNCDGFAAHL